MYRGDVVPKMSTPRWPRSELSAPFSLSTGRRRASSMPDGQMPSDKGIGVGDDAFNTFFSETEALSLRATDLGKSKRRQQFRTRSSISCWVAQGSWQLHVPSRFLGVERMWWRSGSGLGFLLLTRLSVDYENHRKHSASRCGPVRRSRPSWLSLTIQSCARTLCWKTDLAVMMDNEIVCAICRRNLDIERGENNIATLNHSEGFWHFSRRNASCLFLNHVNTESGRVWHFSPGLRKAKCLL